MACNVRSNVGLCVCLVVRSNIFGFWFLLPKMPNGPMWMVDRTYCRPVMKLYIRLTLHLETDANDGHMPVRPFRYETSSVVVCQPASQPASLPSWIALHCIHPSNHTDPQLPGCLGMCEHFSLTQFKCHYHKSILRSFDAAECHCIFHLVKVAGKNSQQKNRRNTKQSKKNSRPHHAAVWATLFFSKEIPVAMTSNAICPA